MTIQRQLQEATTILKDLKRCGSFYYTAIEFDRYIKDPIDGEEFEKRIDKLLEDMDPE